MKKKKTSEDLDDDLRPHYEFDYSKMKRNPYAGEKKVDKRQLAPKPTTSKQPQKRKAS